MTIKSYYLASIILILNCIFCSLKAQNSIKGIVIDSISGEPLPFISINLKGTSIGVLTDNEGKFNLKIPSNRTILCATSITFKPKYISFNVDKSNNLKILLCRKDYSISEVVVRKRNLRYKKKGNPAVDFVRKVIESKNKYNPLNKAYYSNFHNQKVQVAINGFQKDKYKNTLKRFDFLTNYVDTSEFSGKPILPISMKEINENYFFRNKPRSEKRFCVSKKNTGIDEMLSDEGVEQFLKEAFKDVDIYANDIYLFLKPFVSPLSVGGPDFYKYYLLDTVQVAGEKCMDLGFVPIVPESSGFSGHLYITLDSTNFVKKVKLRLPRYININFIQNLSLNQEFERANDGTRLLMRDDIAVEFSLVPKSDGFYARRTNLYSNHSFICPNDTSIFNKNDKLTVDYEQNKTEIKTDTSKINVKSVENMLKELRHDPTFYWSEKVISALVTGYVQSSSIDNKFNIGPVYSTLSANAVEGLRLRIGGHSTPNLNKKWFAKGYLAYGTYDQKFKGLAELEYSFINKKTQVNEFPVNSLRASYYYDLNRLGQNYLYTTADNLLLSIKRQPDDKITYLRKLELSYNREFYSQFSVGLDFRYRTEFATPIVQFSDNVSSQNFNYLTTSELQLRLRYAPGERYYQGIGRRRTFKRDIPVFTLSHYFAQKGFLGSDYDYNRTEFGFQQRFWFSILGNANIILKAGKVWSKSPFPLLLIPSANLSYTTQYESYAMLNAMEFINDQYLSWDVNYNLNGLILNALPLIKGLKLREILTFRGFYGSLSKQNDPTLSTGLLKFPDTVYKMSNEPYMEAGIGIVNIFKFLRIDYIWRLNYLNHLNIDKSGLRFNLDFYF